MSRRSRFLLIHNPLAGRDAHRQLIVSVAGNLRQAGVLVDMVATEYAGHATVLAANAVRAGFDTVVAAGGDGTVSEVVQALCGTDIALATIPAGTVNLWSSEIGMPSAAGGIADVLLHGDERLVDVGCVGDRKFLLMASIGLDAAIVQGLALGLKRAVGRLAYGVSFARIAPRYSGTAVRLILDGKTIECTALMIVIGNTRRYAGRMQATAHAIADDGMLDVVVMRGASVWQGISQAGAVLSGVPACRRSLLYGRAREIEVRCERELPMQADGDFQGYAPATFRAMHRALRVVVGSSPTTLFATPAIGAEASVVENARGAMANEWTDARDRAAGQE